MTDKNLALRPNCLLTHSPLVFVTGPRSLFCSEKMGEPLQEFIQAHGYKIQPLWMPFRSKAQRHAALQTWLQIYQTRSFHFFMAEQTWIELQKTLENNFHPHSTITVINLAADTPRSQIAKVDLQQFEVKPTLKTQIPLTYRLHQLFSAFMISKALPYEQTLLVQDPHIYNRFLDHCIELAENEFRDLTSRM